MRRSMMIIISSMTIMMMASACAHRGDDLEAAFHDRLVRHYTEDDRAARAMNAEPLRLDITFVDLHGDGAPEAIVRLDHPAFCGSRGCAIDVIRFEDVRIVVLGAFIAHEAALRHDATTQRRHIVVDNRVWIVCGDQVRPWEP